MNGPADPGRVLVDAAAALLLTSVALAGWATTYDGSRWLLVGLTGAVLGTVVAAALAVRGWGADVLVLLLAPVYLLGAVLATTPRIGPGVFEDVAAGTRDSWVLLLGTHPPVPGDGALLLPPYAVGLLGGGIATAFALRSRNPGLPLVPPLLALGAVLVLGRHEPVALAGQSLAFGGLAAGWVFVRGMRLEVTGRTPAPLSRVALGTVVLAVAALAAGPVAERVGDPVRPRLVLREVVPAYDVSDVDTPLASFRTFTDQPPREAGNVRDVVLFEVLGLPAGSRLRFGALDTYNGVQFRAGNDTVAGRYDDRFLRLAGALDNPATGRERFVNVSPTRAWTGQWLPTAGAVQWFGFDGRDVSRRLADVRYNPATSTGVLIGDQTVADDYEFATLLPRDRLTRAMRPWPDLDQDLVVAARFAEDIARVWTRGAGSPMAAVFRAAETLRASGRYSDGAPGSERRFLPGHDRERLGEEFLEGGLTGNDEQYAAAMALVATRLGVPARVVVGAVVPESGVVRGRDVHAWVELRVADGTWRTLPTEAFMGNRRPEAGRLPRAPAPIQQPALPPQPPRPEPEPEPESESSADPAPITSDEPARWPWVLPSLAVAGGVVPLFKWWRRRRRRRAQRVTMRYAGAWLELVDQACDLGRPVPRAMTRQAQAALVGRGLDLAWEADRVIFGIDEPTAPDAADFWDAVDAERAALRAGASRGRRLLAPLHPGSLRHRFRSSTRSPRVLRWSLGQASGQPPQAHEAAGSRTALGVTDAQ